MKTEEFWNMFLNDNDYLAPMAKHVIEQLGGVDAYNMEVLSNVRSGADGYSGFIYHNEMAEYWAAARADVLPYMEEQCTDIGYANIFDMIEHFNCFGNGSVSMKDISLALYGNIDDVEDRWVPTALAQYTLEEVACRFSDWLDSDAPCSIDDLNDDDTDDDDA